MADETANKALGIEEIASLLEGYARPYVEIGLLRMVIKSREEKQDEDKTKKEARAIKRCIDKGLSAEFPRMGKQKTDKLRREFHGLVDILKGGEVPMPDEEEITHYLHETAEGIATGWVEYLALTLKKETEIPLNKCLLPKNTASIDSELQKAYDENLAQLVIRSEDVSPIMERLAHALFESRSRVDLVLGVYIEKLQDGYVARHS